MSSIYKKGRDGYYYYQTYVYNPETKKKDKRIFHALRTKDLYDAKLKQEQLDLQYDNKNYSENKLSIIYNLFNLRYSLLSVILGAAVIFIFSNLPKLNTNNQELIVLSENINNEKIKEDDNSNLAVDDDIRVNVIKDKNITASNLSAENNSVIISKPTVPVLIIPEYTIERVDTLPGAFKQGKLYVTIGQSVNRESQLQLCKKLTRDYNQFSNIIICLYSNNSFGVDLARGNNKVVNTEEQKQVWLAMYSYNSVEGEYFDDNPSGYLGL